VRDRVHCERVERGTVVMLGEVLSAISVVCLAIAVVAINQHVWYLRKQINLLAKANIEFAEGMEKEWGGQK